MKSITIALAALAIGAGSLTAGDWNYWRQQQESNEFNRRQAEWQAEFDRRQDQIENERRFQQLEDDINRNRRNRFDFDFE